MANRFRYWVRSPFHKHRNDPEEKFIDYFSGGTVEKIKAKYTPTWKLVSSSRTSTLTIPTFVVSCASNETTSTRFPEAGKCETFQQRSSENFSVTRSNSSTGSSVPLQMTGPSNFPSNQMNMSLAPQNGPFQQPNPDPMCISVLQESHQVYHSQPGTVTMSAVQGSQVHHHHHHFHPQIGFEQMRSYAFHAQAQAYSLWYQQTAAMQSAQIFGPHPFQPFPTNPINTAPHKNPFHHQRSQRREYVKPFTKDQVKISKDNFSKSCIIDKEEIFENKDVFVF